MRPRRIGRVWILIGVSSAFTFATQAAHARQQHSTWGQILIAGGPYDGGVDLYDPASNRFAPEISTPQMKGRTRATATLLLTGPNAGKVLIAGGDNRNDVPRASTELYDPATNTVVQGPTLRIPRSGHTATTIPSGPNVGRILFAGGMGAFTGNLASTEIYDPATNTFSFGPSMSTGCALCTATVIASGKNAGRILFVGGYDSHRVPGLTELYDPAANAFVPGPITSPPCDAVIASVIPSGKNVGKILFAGCDQLEEGDNDTSTELYDPATDKFVRGPTMRLTRLDHTETAIAAGPSVGKILIAGGDHADSDETGREASLASTELYDPDTNTITSGPAMNARRVGHTATVILSGKNRGKILIAGGIERDTDKNGTGIFLKLASTELYDPATNAFAPGPEMNAPRFDAVAVQLPPAPNTLVHRQGTRSIEPASSLKTSRETSSVSASDSAMPP